MSAKAKPETEPPPTYAIDQTVIVVVTAGWVFVGRIRELTERCLVIDTASNIRHWGTTKGLGELAVKGPLKATVLDAVGIAWLERRHVLFCLPCSWDAKL